MEENVKSGANQKKDAKKLMRQVEVKARSRGK